MAVIESGDSSGKLLTVNANNQALVNLPTTDSQAGYARILDSSGNAILTTENGALDTSTDTIILFEQVDGSALNTNVWNTSTDTMTIAQTGGYITLNSAAITTVNKYAILQSIKSIAMYGFLPLKVAINAKVSTLPEANAVIEVGIGTVATNAAPTDGVFFRWNASAELRAIINNGGAEIQSALIDASTYAPVGDATLFEVVVVEDQAQFFIDDVLVAEIPCAVGQSFPTNAGRLTVFARVYTGGSIPAIAPQVSIGQVIAVQQAMNQNRRWAETLAALGRGAHQSPITTFAQTANHANSTSPSSATLSNTAAGYTTLGGRWQFAAVAAAATDFALFAFQVPAGYQLFVSRVSISAAVTGLAVVTATILDWAVGVNSSAVSLATADSPPTSWAPRRIPLGLSAFQALVGIGTQAPDIVREFDTPLVVDGGRYFHIILQVPNGAATGSLIFRGDVTVNGYFE